MSGVLGCVDCKKNCAKKIAQFFAPLREKRAYYENHSQEVNDIIDRGIATATSVAKQTMQEVHTVMKMG